MELLPRPGEFIFIIHMSNKKKVVGWRKGKTSKYQSIIPERIDYKGKKEGVDNFMDAV